MSNLLCVLSLPTIVGTFLWGETSPSPWKFLYLSLLIKVNSWCFTGFLKLEIIFFFWVLTLHFLCVQFSHSVVSDYLRPHGLQHAMVPWPLPTPRAQSNPCPLRQWCHRTISSSVVIFSSCLKSFTASGSFPMRQFFASGDQSIGVSASASVLPMNIQDWFPLGWAGWGLQSKGLSRVL